MKHATTPAFDMLRSLDFFTDLRTAMQGVGLAGEEGFGVGVYFAAASRFFQNPLRLCIQEQTDGGADYVVRRAAKLLQPGNFVELHIRFDPGLAWFHEKPCTEGRLSSRWGRRLRYGNSVRFEVVQNQISRVAPVKKDKRVVEERENVEASFACISSDHRDWMRDSSQWLTMLFGQTAAGNGEKRKFIFPVTRIHWTTNRKSSGIACRISSKNGRNEEFYCQIGRTGLSKKPARTSGPPAIYRHSCKRGKRCVCCDLCR